MANRALPEWRNPMLEEDRAPTHEILVERRCLGQTELKVKPGQMGTSNATKPENLGVLDYAHLRVPLPKDLSQSGIFSKGPNRKYPEAYFLMRRSSDGYISATGMFKAAFPYAQQEDEANEKEHIKTLPATSTEEVAGNVWIHPEEALALAEEYGIKLWIAALLDPQPITHGTSDPDKSIKSPPTYRLKEMANGIGRSPEEPAETKTPKRSVRRSTRSVSPSLAPPKTAERVKATPRKRGGRKALSAIKEGQASVEPESVNGDAAETVKVEVETTTDAQGETEKTKVNIEMPASHPDLPVPNDAQEMLKQARAMVEEAQQLDNKGSASKSKAKGKRKAEDMVEPEEEQAAAQPAKKARKTEVELRKEKIRRRALTGIAATLAVGALIPSIISAFPWA